MAGRIIGHQHESIGDFALVFEDEDSAAARDAGRELSLAPTDLQRRDDVIEQIGGDAAGVIPIFPEAEEAIAIIGTLRRRAEPGLPVDVVVALALRTGFGVDRPAVVPLAADRVAMVGALAHDHLADHAVGNGLARLPPLVAGSGLRSDLENALGLFYRVDQLLDLLVGVAHGLLEVHILAVIHGVESDLGVPVVRGGDDN